MKKCFPRIIFIVIFLSMGIGQAQASFAPVSDSLKVYDSSTNIVTQVSVLEIDEVATNVILVPGAGTLYTVDMSQYGNPTYLIEPGTSNVSDLFGIYVQGGTAYLAFDSDDETTSLPFFTPPPRILVNENSATGQYDATMYLNPSLQAAPYYYTAQFYSDPDPVPIPAAVWLLGSGLIGLVAIRRRLKT